MFNYTIKTKQKTINISLICDIEEYIKKDVFDRYYIYIDIANIYYFDDIVKIEKNNELIYLNKIKINANKKRKITDFFYNVELLRLLENYDDIYLELTEQAELKIIIRNFPENNILFGYIDDFVYQKEEVNDDTIINRYKYISKNGFTTLYLKEDYIIEKVIDFVNEHIKHGYSLKDEKNLKEINNKINDKYLTITGDFTIRPSDGSDVYIYWVDDNITGISHFTKYK